MNWPEQNSNLFCSFIVIVIITEKSLWRVSIKFVFVLYSKCIGKQGVLASFVHVTVQSERKLDFRRSLAFDFPPPG